MLDDIKTADRAEKWMMDALRRRPKSWASVIGFTKRATRGCRLCAKSRAISGSGSGKEDWVPICETLEATMEREKHLCANVDLYAAPGLHHVGVSTRLEYPDLRRLARRRLVRACRRATGSQPLDSARSLYTGPAMRPYKGSPNGA
jgi:hypothetical protein